MQLNHLLLFGICSKGKPLGVGHGIGRALAGVVDDVLTLRQGAFTRCGIRGTPGNGISAEESGIDGVLIHGGLSKCGIEAAVYVIAEALDQVRCPQSTHKYKLFIVCIPRVQRAAAVTFIHTSIQRRGLVITEDAVFVPVTIALPLIGVHVDDTADGIYTRRNGGARGIQIAAITQTIQPGAGIQRGHERICGHGGVSHGRYQLVGAGNSTVMAKLINVGSTIDIAGIGVTVFIVERKTHLTIRKDLRETVKHVCCAIHKLGGHQRGTTVGHNRPLRGKCVIDYLGIASHVRHQRDGERGRTIRVAHLNISSTGSKSTCVTAEIQVVLQIISGIDNTSCCRRGKRGNSSHGG